MDIYRGMVHGVMLAGFFPSVTLAQDQCRPADSTAAAFVAHIARYASAESGGQAAVRDSLRLRYTPTERVVLITNNEVCRQAAAAYRTELTTAAETHTGRVYVVQARDRVCGLGPGVPYRSAPTVPRDELDHCHL